MPSIVHVFVSVSTHELDRSLTPPRPVLLSSEAALSRKVFIVMSLPFQPLISGLTPDVDGTQTCKLWMSGVTGSEIDRLDIVDAKAC